jgi:predicted amidohydrolase YtcJ
MIRQVLVFFLMLMSATAVLAQTAKVPDTIYYNGDVHIDFSDRCQGLEDCFYFDSYPAIAIIGDRVAAVGEDDEVRRLAGPATTQIDLHGAFVMPGFNDAHIHLWSGGLEGQRVDVTGARSLAEMQARIADKIRSGVIAKGDWVLGRGWDHTLWPGQKLPNRRDLDAVTAGHPAYFVRVDGHIGVANSAALKVWGITRRTRDPQGGKIDRDARGEPTGILRERAKEKYTRLLPPPSMEQRRRAVINGLAAAARAGLTSVQDSPVNPTDTTEWQYFLIYEELEQSGKLTARVNFWLPFIAPLDVLQQHRSHHPANDSMLHTGMLKAYLDGSLGSRTAAMLAPFSDDPGNTGIAYTDQTSLNAAITERALAGYQVGFHAIGDRGMQMALDAFAAADRALRDRNKDSGGVNALRPRVEHAQVLAPDQFKRMAAMGVIASMQPNHLLTDLNWAVARIGNDRAKYSYAWRSMLRNDVHLAFGTDYPVEPLAPFRGVYSAVTRKSEDGSKEYFPAEKLTIQEALAAYTSDAAYAEFMEKEKGTLYPGMLADFVVLDRDLTKIAPEEILKTKVLRTVVGGKTVYEAPAAQ